MYLQLALPLVKYISVENRSYSGDMHFADTADVARYQTSPSVQSLPPWRPNSKFPCNLTTFHAVWSDRYSLIDCDGFQRYSGSINCRMELAINTLSLAVRNIIIPRSFLQLLDLSGFIYIPVQVLFGLQHALNIFGYCHFFQTHFGHLQGYRCAEVLLSIYRSVGLSCESPYRFRSRRPFAFKMF